MDVGNKAVYGIPIPCRHCIAHLAEELREELLGGIPFETRHLFESETEGPFKPSWVFSEGVLISDKKTKKEPLKGWKAIKNHPLFAFAKCNPRVMFFGSSA